MALKKLIFKPGINRDTTNYSQGSGSPDGQAGWFSANKIRFLSGFPQKLGGWKLYSTGVEFAGVVRTLFNWSKDAYNFLAVGTNTNVFVENQGVYHNITPIRATFVSTASDNCFSTVSDAVIAAHPTWIKVTLAGAYADAGDTVIFSGAVGFDGIASATLNAAHIVLEDLALLPYSANYFYIDVGTYVSTGVAGGGTAITAEFEVGIGGNVAYSGGGWGAPSWGGNVESPKLGWGVGSLTPIFLPIRIVYFDKFTNDLVFNYRYGGPNTTLHSVPQSMYRWLFDPLFTTRAQSIADAAAAAGFSSADVPPEVTQIMFDDNSNTLMAFGCNPYDVTPQPVDPLLIRWASQNDYLNWTPSDDAGISTAGYLRIQSGSSILQAVSNAKEILVFTESSITSVQYTYSYPNLFSQTLISSDVSLFAPRAVIAINNTLYWMGRDKFYIYNGRAEALDCTLTLHVFDNLNFNQSDQCFAVHVEKYLEVWWFYCSGSSTIVNSYVVYKYDDSIWYYGNCDDGFVRTGWSSSSLRPFPQAAEPTVVEGLYTGTSRLYNQESGVDAGLLPMTSYIQSADIDLPESGEHFVLIKRIIPDISFTDSEGAPYVNFTVAPRNFPGSPYMTQNQEGQYFPRRVDLQSTTVLDQYTEQVFVRARARQMAIAISSDTLGTHWSLGAVRADVVPDGRRGIGTPPGILLAGRCVNGADICVGAVSTFYQGLTVEGVESLGQIGLVGDSGPLIPNLMVGGVKATGQVGAVLAFAGVLPATPLLRLDAANTTSYPGTGTNWNDLSGNGYTTTLNSNTVYDASGGGAPAMKFANPLRQTASGTAIAGTAGVITCSALATPVYIGSTVQVSGIPSGSGAISGYINPTTYFVTATNGSTSFTLSATLGGAAVTTTAGTSTGLTFYITSNSYAQVPTAMIETLSINSGLTPTQINQAYTFDIWVKFSDLSSFTPLTGVGSSLPNSALILDGATTTGSTNNIVRIGSVDGGSYLRAGLTQYSGVYGQIDSTTGPWAPLVDRWYNLTMVNTAGLSQTSDAIKLYVDGVLVSSGRAYSALNPTNITGLLRSVNGSNWLTIGANSYTGGTSAYTYLSQSIKGWIPVVNGYARALTALEIQQSNAYYAPRFTNPALPAAVSPALYGTPIALYDTAITDYGQYGSYAVGGSLFTPTFKYDGNGTYPITGGLINQVDYLTTTPVVLNVTGIGSPGGATSGKITYSSIATTYPAGLPPMTPIVVTGTNTGTGQISPTYVSGSVWWTGYYNYSVSGVTPTTTSVIISPNGPKEYSSLLSAANSSGVGPLDSTAGTLAGLIFTAYPNTNPLNANGVAGFSGAYIDNSTGLLPTTLTSARPLAVFGLGDSRLTLFPSTNLQNILINRSAFSINVWYRHTSFASSGAVIAQYFGGNYYWPSGGNSDIGMCIGNITGASNLVSAGIWNRAAGVWASTATVTQVVDTWYNYTMTFSGGAGTITFYCNNVSIGTAAVSGTITQPTPVNPIAVTRNWNSGGETAYPGKLGALQIYDVELTSTQVTQNWNHFRTRYGV